jgi:hypothetical protein
MSDNNYGLNNLKTLVDEAIKTAEIKGLDNTILTLSKYRNDTALSNLQQGEQYIINTICDYFRIDINTIVNKKRLETTEAKACTLIVYFLYDALGMKLKPISDIINKTVSLVSTYKNRAMRLNKNCNADTEMIKDRLTLEIKIKSYLNGNKIK